MFFILYGKMISVSVINLFMSDNLF